LGVKAKIVGAILSASTIAGGAALEVYEYRGYQPNDVIHLTEECAINKYIGSLACHSVISPGLSEISESLDKRAVLMGTPMVIGFAAICEIFALGGIVRSRRYY
jgi:hypothetical protein